MGQKFKFNHNIRDKKLEAIFEGRFEIEDGIEFVSEYKRVVRGIDPKSYELELDCVKLTVATQEVATQLGECFKLYKEDGFKTVRFRLPGEETTVLKMQSAGLKMQFGRIAREVGLKNLEFIK